MHKNKRIAKKVIFYHFIVSNPLFGVTTTCVALLPTSDGMEFEINHQFSA